MSVTLTQRRRERTIAANRVLDSIRHMLTEPAKWAIGGQPVSPDWVGLPSWWPFWSDCLKDNVRKAVRAGRALELAEYQPTDPRRI